MKLASTMTGAGLKDALTDLYGDRWRIDAPDALGMQVSTLDRQVNGQTPVQATTEATVKALAQVKHYREQSAARQRSYKKRKAEA